MNPLLRSTRQLIALAAVCVTCAGIAQPPDGPPPGNGGPGFDGPPRFFPGGPGGRPGFGGPPNQEIELLKKFDLNSDKKLDAAERKAAREYLQKERAQGRNRRGPGPGGMGGPGFRRPGGENQEPPQPGAKLSPGDVKNYPDAPLYDPLTVRTYFLEFEDTDWEQELAEFKDTDVEVPAKLTVDGKTFPEVGVHFRGMSSFMAIGNGQKRSINVSLDFTDKKQQIGGYRTLNLLNSHEDPTFLRSVLYYQIAREYIPAPKANFARVVINGENWGLYPNVQQFNKDFIKEWFGTTKGARWKVRGSPGGRGGMNYLGEEAAPYKNIFTIKSKDDPKAWADLIHLCKVLNDTPASELQAALEPILDIDGTLKFLALDNALINNDGFWIRSSDYSLYEDQKGRFHFIPQDANETFLRPEGPGGPGGMGRRRGPGGFGGPNGPDERPGGREQVKGVELDPLVDASDSSKPLLSKLLAVPSLRQRYLSYVGEIASKWLDWQKLGPIATQYHTLIAEYVKADTRKLDSTEEFMTGLAHDIQGSGGFGPRGRGIIGLKNFAEQRREYLLNHPAVKAAAGGTGAGK